MINHDDIQAQLPCQSDFLRIIDPTVDRDQQGITGRGYALDGRPGKPKTLAESIWQIRLDIQPHLAKAEHHYGSRCYAVRVIVTMDHDPALLLYGRHYLLDGPLHMSEKEWSSEPVGRGQKVAAAAASANPREANNWPLQKERRVLVSAARRQPTHKELSSKPCLRGAQLHHEDTIARGPDRSTKYTTSGRNG